MRATVAQPTLLNFLTKIKRAVNPKHLIPSLTGVRIAALPGALSIQGTDLIVSLRGEVAAGVEEPGSLVVDAERFYKIVSCLPRQNISLVANHELAIECERTRYKLPLLSFENYPQLPMSAHTKSDRTYNSTQLRTLLKSTIHACSATPTREALGGLMLEFGNRVRAAGMATGWLVTRGILEELEEIYFRALLPIVGAEFLLSVLEDNLALDIFRQGDILFVVPLSSGREQTSHYTVKLFDEAEFPDYMRFIPTAYSWRFSVALGALYDALKRTLVLGSTILRFTASPQSKLVISSTEKGAEASERVEIVTEITTGKDLSLLVNGKFLMEVLDHLEEKRGVLSFSGPEDPILLQAGDLTAVMMPMKL